jgi:valyl-tRNA synthetase
MAKTASFGLARPSDRTQDGMVTSVLGWCEVAVMAPEGFDFDRARAAVSKKLDEVTAHHSQHQARLDNPDFVAKAAPEMQEQMQRRALELAGQRELLRRQLRLLEEAN